ncbi:TolC family protein [Amphritea sp. 1_MG-2023]|uniref:TolC family protein n=1 Tax=Amphritea sp. 1_MG-2023 TaxID=3062670 RepID=UPI0026E168BD|nr:TolC family protein [Amphritea sp. 1_MG-2023]MDO6564938.1 TolC family protein [Amphritea sp. 1_MG-2023]
MSGGALNKKGKLLGGTILIALLGGCSVQPQLMTISEQQDLVTDDRQNMFAEQESITKPISLEEAIARAIKYNLNYRLSMMEEVLKSGELDLEHVNMLPRIAANAGWRTRSNDNLNNSRNVATGVVSNDPSLSQDRDKTTADLTMTWNVLDFGVSYLQAKQNADKVLIAREKKRSMVNQIVQQVRSAYWRAATATPLANEVRPLLIKAEKALADSQSSERARLVSPLESLEYQKGLIEVIRNLEQVENDMVVAKVELAALMGLPPTTDYTLVLPDINQLHPPEFNFDISKMEETALVNRPELKEEAYQKRITALESRKALLRLMPGLTFDAGINYNSNSYLVNNQWNEAGLRVSWSLINLVSAPVIKDISKAREDIGDARRLALGVAVITQVHVAYQDYLRRIHSYKHVRMLNDIEQRIYGHIKNASIARAQSPLQEIRGKLAGLLAEVKHYQSYAELQEGISNLYVTMGLNPLPEVIENDDLDTLKTAIATVMDEWQRGENIGLQKEVKVSNQDEVTQSHYLESKQNVEATLQGWLKAWSHRDIDAYLAYYVTDFQSAKHAHSADWVAERRKRLSDAKDIQIKRENTDITISGSNRANVRFRQIYHAHNYSDDVIKHLELYKTSYGWKIIKEETE